MKHIAFKSLSIMTKTSLVLLIIAMISVAGFAIRLSKGPINLDFAKDYIENALNQQMANNSVSVNSLMLEWSSYKNALLLTLGDLRLYQKQDNLKSKVLEVDNAKLGLSIPYLLAGQIKPSSIVIDAPILNLSMKDGKYDLLLSGHSTNNEKETDVFYGEKTTDNLDARQRIIKILEEITNPTSSVFAQLSELKEIILKQAVLKQVIFEDNFVEGDNSALDIGYITDNAIDDIVFETVEKESNYIALFDLDIKRSKYGLNGDLDATIPSEKGSESKITAAISYRTKQKDLTFEGKIFNLNPSRFSFIFPDEPLLAQQDFVLNGDMKLALGEKLQIQNALLKLNIDNGYINIPNEFNNPINIKNAVLDLSINRLEQKFTLNGFNATIGDIPINAKSEGYFKKGNIYFPIEIKIPEVKFTDIAKLIPNSQKNSSASNWLEHRLSDGKIFDVTTTTQINLHRGKEQGKTILSIKEPKVTFNFEGITVKYSGSLMPVTKADGSGIYEKDSLTIKGDTANIEDIIGTNINVELTDLSVAGGGLAKIKLNGQGPLKTVLKYIKDKPIELSEKDTGLNPKTVEGNIDFDLSLNFPTLKNLPKEEVTVVIDGTINDAKLPKIVRDLDLTGGPYNLTFSKGEIGLKGKGKLSDRDIELNYQQYLDPKGKDFDMKVNAKLLADKQLRDAFSIGLNNYISGNVPVDINYIEQVNGDATVDVKGSMSPTIITIAPFNFTKPQGVDGSFSLKAILKNNVLTEVKNLNLNTKNLSFENGRLLFKNISNDDSELYRGEIQKVTLGKTVANVDFEITPDNVLKTIANGSIIDISPFINKNNKNPQNWKNPAKTQGQAMKISLKAERAYTTKDQYLKNAQFYIETDKDSDITRLEIDANVGKSSDFYVRFKPEEQSGKRTFRMESNDAGSTLRIFDLYENMVGGSLLIYGQPQTGDNKGDLFGTARIKNFTIVKAPALARLLGAMSENGIQDTLKTNGISFEKLESKFEWRFRDSGNLLVVKDGRTSGSSLGLTFEGIADMGKNILDLGGTIIPLSGINKAIGDIPLLGTLLTGGSKGGLFAATYTIKGSSNDPKVVVNPLSALTPGFLRKILFEGDLESKLPENKLPQENKTINE